MTEVEAPGFDPAHYFRKLRGRNSRDNYLDVKWRLVWLRKVDPDAGVDTQQLMIDHDGAIFRATITLKSGGTASGYGSETRQDFADFIEKAETKAIGRALNHLGFSAEMADPDGSMEDATAGEPIVSRPVGRHRDAVEGHRDTEQVADNPSTWKGQLAYWRNQIDLAEAADQLLAVREKLLADKKRPQLIVDYLDQKRTMLGLPPFTD